MCGLVGVFSKYGNGMNNNHRDAFTTLLLIDALRGDDSTGAMLIHTNGDVDVIKEASVSGEFLRSKEWKDLHGRAWHNGACLIGHNRKATRGDICDENAHPFIVDDKIVLVHNGGMWGDHKKHADVQVDSHAIAHLINRNESIEEALTAFHGAYALMWYDVEEETVRIIRNKERTLWWMETSDAYIWASEKPMLMFTAARNNLQVIKGPILLDEDALNEFKLHDKRWEVTHRKLDLTRRSTNMGTQQKKDWENDNLFESWKEQTQAIFRDDEESCLPCSALPQNQGTFGRPNAAMTKPHTLTVGAHNFESTSDFERAMARGCNKMVTMGEFNVEILNAYMYGAKVRCECFEWIEDGDGGYYVYASPLDDPEVIFRHRFSRHTKTTEERVMTMALNGWIFEFTVATKSWSDFDPDSKSHNNTDEGYCIITSSNAQLIKGGGVQSLDIKESANA